MPSDFAGPITDFFSNRTEAAFETDTTTFHPETQTKPPKRLQIVFLATGAFAVPSMRALCDSGRFDIICLVTNPLRHDKSGRPIITPARHFAREYGIEISEKEDVHSREFYEFIHLVKPDLLFVCDFGQILSKRVLEGPLLGGINLHGSLLPKYRGAAPVHWAIFNGELFTGVSVIHMTPKVDAGPVIAQSPPIPIGPRETVPELEDRLAAYGAELILDTVIRMSYKEPVRIIEQIHRKASKAPRLKKESGLVDWSRPSRAIYNHYRAMAQWPKSFTDRVRDDGSKVRVILGDLVPLDDSFQELIDEDFNDPVFVAPVLMDAKLDNLAVLRSRWLESSPEIMEKRRKWRKHHNRPSFWKPGVVLRAEGDELIVAAGEGAVRILQIQPAGKKMMQVADFLRGYPIKPGDRFE